MVATQRLRPPKREVAALNALDGRTVLVRHGRDLRAALERDLGGDLSTAQAILAERAVTLAMFCERCEVAWLETNELHESYLSCVNALRHVLTSLGLERRARDVTPSVAEYLKSKGAT
jgi:hypothetical protein